MANPKAFLQGQLDPELARRFFLPADLSLEVCVWVCMGVWCVVVDDGGDAIEEAAFEAAYTQTSRTPINPNE